MSQLVSNAVDDVQGRSFLPPSVWQELKQIFIGAVEDQIWKWYAQNAEKILIRINKKVVFFKVSVAIKVRDIKPLLEALLGDQEPSTIEIN